MSNGRSNKQSTVKGKHLSTKNNAKKKKAFRFKENEKKLVTGNHKEVEIPKDAAHISANWKAFKKEIIKNRELERKSPKGYPNERHVKHAKKNGESSSAIVCRNNSGLEPRIYVEEAKHKNVSNTVITEDVQDMISSVTQAKPPSASKRKRKTGQQTSESFFKNKKKLIFVKKKPTSDDLWFDDVDPDDIEATIGAEAADIFRKRQHLHTQNKESSLVKENAFDGLTKAVAIDCEMVGTGPDGEDSILARVSLVNQFGKCIYDKFVKPTEKVTDFRTSVSGIRPKDIADGEDVTVVRKEVAEIVQGRVIVGHAIHNDLKILLLDHPKKKIRDTQKYKPFRKAVKSVRPSLKVLCKEILHVKVQQGEHSSVQDAQATMRLYTMVKKKWEAEIKANHNKKDTDQKNVKRKAKLPKNTGRNYFEK